MVSIDPGGQPVKRTVGMRSRGITYQLRGALKARPATERSDLERLVRQRPASQRMVAAKRPTA